MRTYGGFALSALLFCVLACARVSAAEALPAEQPPAESPPAEATAEKPAPETSAAPAPQPSPTAMAMVTGHATRVAANFLTLMGNAWAETLAFAGRLVLAIVLWSIAFLLFFGLAGLLLWRALARRGGFDATWKWYRYVRWTWPVLFVLLPAAGGSYAGGWYGGGRCLKQAVLEDRVVDRVVMHLYCAIALDRADYEVKGQESIAAYEAILKDSEKGQRVFEQDFENAMHDLVNEDRQGLWMYVLVKLTNGFVSRKLVDSMRGVDPRALVILFLKHPNIDEYVKENPNASPALMALSSQFAAARALVGDSIDSVVATHALIGTFAGLGIPLLLWAIFLLTRHYCKGKPAKA